MTANYSKGSKGKHYPYYLCRQAGCPSNSKSISRDKVETAFGELLRSLAPARELFDLAAAIFRDLWNDQASKAKERKKAMAKELTEIDRKVAQVVDRIVDAESKTVIGALEKRLDEMEQRKLLLAENIAKCGTPAYVLKGASPEAASQFGLERLEPGGRIIGKRCGTSAKHRSESASEGCTERMSGPIARAREAAS